MLLRISTRPRVLALGLLALLVFLNFSGLPQIVKACATNNWQDVRTYMVNYAKDDRLNPDGTPNPNAHFDPALFAGYDVITLDPNNVTAQTLQDIRAAAARTNSFVFITGYISVGETPPPAPLTDASGHIRDIYFLNSAGQPISNTNWSSYYVDARKPAWSDPQSGLVFTDYLPKIVNMGFDGFFLDTVDTSAYIDASKGIDFSVSAPGMAALIRNMKTRYPDKYIIMNRGFHLLAGDSNDVAASINGVMFESFNSTWASQVVNSSGQNNTCYRAYAPDSDERIWSDGIARRLNQKRWLYNADGTVQRWADGTPKASSTFFHVMSHDYALASQTALMQSDVNTGWGLGFVPSLSLKDLSQPPAYDWTSLVTVPAASAWGQNLAIHNMPTANPVIDNFDSGVANWLGMRGVIDEGTGQQCAAITPDTATLSAASEAAPHNGFARLNTAVLGTTAWKNAAKLQSIEWPTASPANFTDKALKFDLRVSALPGADKSFQATIKDTKNDVMAWTFNSALGAANSWTTIRLNPGDGVYYQGWDRPAGAPTTFWWDKIKSIQFQVVNNTDASSTYTAQLDFDSIGLESLPITSVATHNDATSVTYSFNYSSAYAGGAYMAFVDTDQAINATTGKKTGYQLGGLGAEYMVQNGLVYMYTGDGSSWNWQQVGTATSFTNNSTTLTVSWTIARTVYDPTTSPKAADIVFRVEGAGQPGYNSLIYTHTYS